MLIAADKIQKLSLANNELGDSAAEGIAKALETNSTLTSLSLHGNKIGASGGLALAGALEKNTSLTSLFLTDSTRARARASVRAAIQLVARTRSERATRCGLV